MRLHLERLSTRFPGGKTPAFISAAVLCGYLTLHILLESGLKLCWFKAVTGINCPTCGLSRAILALFHGDLPEAFRFNPFMLLFTLGIALYFGSGLIFKRRLALEASARERTLLLIIFLALFLLNWLYLILFVG